MQRLTSIIEAGAVTTSLEFKSVIGELGFAAGALVCLKPQLGLLQCAQHRMPLRGGPHQLDRPILDTLRTLRASVQANRSRRFPTSPHRGPRAVMYVDASKEGFGGTLQLYGTPADRHRGRRLVQGFWPRTVGPSQMPQAELAAVVLLVQRWAPELAGRNVTVYGDNLPVCTSLRKGSARRLCLNRLLGPLFTTVTRHDFQLFSQHVSSKANFVADALSRNFSPRHFLRWGETVERARCPPWIWTCMQRFGRSRAVALKVWLQGLQPSVDSNNSVGTAGKPRTRVQATRTH